MPALNDNHAIKITVAVEYVCDFGFTIKGYNTTRYLVLDTIY